ncbi:endonuclease V [Chitinophagaceae bacterium LB-8]|jgi:deoxyribonuclease V|uniref:Endonuclease V n=1 Tax=Paraflavisolibacter caeni TaxID=2982496 RepID=A0A9X3B9F7_9BACT|nr:endonuclease V [Paraflavisolibacter caeni]MCU7551196.1 endonuclease V [Paraflavisolibacter caeni]
MKIAVDVYYLDHRAKAVGIEFASWSDAEPLQTYIAMVDGVEAYTPGAFYKRELPCIIKLFEKLSLQNKDVIVIDGYTVLDDEGTYGLGGHLFEVLEKRIPVIGVAKRSFKGVSKYVREVYRGKSERPLYVTAMGMDVDEAANCIQSMHGASRIPDLLKYVDRKTRE